jgi:hypothetical protein
MGVRKNLPAPPQTDESAIADGPHRKGRSFLRFAKKNSAKSLTGDAGEAFIIDLVLTLLVLADAPVAR